jgi:hypothetical protein
VTLLFQPASKALEAAHGGSSLMHDCRCFIMDSAHGAAHRCCSWRLLNVLVDAAHRGCTIESAHYGLQMLGLRGFFLEDAQKGCSQRIHHAQQRKYHFCIPFLGIARPQSQFTHSYVCERSIYSQDPSTFFLQYNNQIDRGNK